MTARQGRNPTVVNILCSAVLLVGVVIVLIALGAHSENKPLKGGARATGTIVKSTYASKSFDEVIAFRDRAGGKHTFKNSNVSDSRRLGTLVSVSYDPAQPSRARVLDKINWQAGVIAGSVVAAVGLALLSSGLRKLLFTAYGHEAPA